MKGKRDVLGHWAGAGAEGANVWLNVITELQGRGVQDIFLACIDGLSGLKEAVHAVFPRTQIQRCMIHQIRQRLHCVTSKDQKAFLADLQSIYQAAREAAEPQLLQLGERRGRCSRGSIAGPTWRRRLSTRPRFAG